MRADSPESALFAKTSKLPLALKEFKLMNKVENIVARRRHFTFLAIFPFATKFLNYIYSV